jgi:glycosyltransferase involved in cell wall biosynthesis
MKILMVLEAEFPPDERVEKEIKSLLDAGFHVTIAAYTRKGLPEKQAVRGYVICRRPISEILYKSSAAILLHPFYFRFWYRFLDSILASEKFDVIHIHDLPQAKTGYQLAVRYGLKLVCDQHEYYSNWIVRTRHYNTFTGRIIRFFSNWKKYEKKYLRRADMVITVDESLRNLYIEKVRISSSKILSLPNTPSAGNFDMRQVDPKVADKFAGRFILFYAGGLDHLRGIDFIVESVARLKNEIENILFLIAGKENNAFKLDPLIRKFHAEECTRYIGWVPLDQLPSYVAASHICLFVPRADNLEINNTIATKIFQYAAMGKPVIVSEARKMKEFVENNNLGFSVKFGDISGFGEVVLKIYRDPAIADSIKLRAVEIARKYTWEETSLPFISGYKQMMS